MELEQLRHFQHVADTGSFSRAAIKLGVSQSATSRQVRNLEIELGVKLFYRHGRGVALTDAGRKLHLTVKPMLAQLGEISETLRDESNEPSGAVVVGMPSSIISTIGAPIAQSFFSGYPKATLHLYEGPSALLLERLESGLIGVAVLYESRRGKNMLVTPLLEEALFLVTPPAVLRGEGASTTLNEVAAARLILPGPQSGLRRAVEQAMQAHNLAPKVIMDMHSVTTVKLLVERGAGSTILPFGAVHREVADGRLGARQIPLEQMNATLVTATAVGQPITRAVQVLLALINAEVRRCVEIGQLRGNVLPGAA
jgi:LysR family nitrogen assimilation transcriptional regulator